jgi:hypothetical protein
MEVFLIDTNTNIQKSEKERLVLKDVSNVENINTDVSKQNMKRKLRNESDVLKESKPLYKKQKIEENKKIVNIDDNSNHLLVPEYAHEVFEYLKKKEVTFHFK